MYKRRITLTPNANPTSEGIDACQLHISCTSATYNSVRIPMIDIYVTYKRRVTLTLGPAHMNTGIDSFSYTSVTCKRRVTLTFGPTANQMHAR